MSPLSVSVSALSILTLGRLVSQLEERVQNVSEEISSLEGVDRRLEELLDKISRLTRQLGAVKVWDQDHANSDDRLAVSCYTRVT